MTSYLYDAEPGQEASPSVIPEAATHRLRSGMTRMTKSAEQEVRNGRWHADDGRQHLDGGVVSHSGSGGGHLGIPHGASVSSLACWRE